QIVPVELGPAEDGERVEPVPGRLFSMNDALDHDLVFRAGDAKAQAVIVPLDRPAQHLVVQVDPAHHHKDDVDHDIALEGLVDPDRIRLFGGEAGGLQHYQHVASI